MEPDYVYVSVPIPSQLFPLLAAYGDAIGIPYNWALAHLAIYGAGGDAVGSADMDAYEELRQMDKALIAMAKELPDQRVGAEDIPF
jgi:hypothetical protein